MIATTIIMLQGLSKIHNVAFQRHHFSHCSRPLTHVAHGKMETSSKVHLPYPATIAKTNLVKIETAIKTNHSYF